MDAQIVGAVLPCPLLTTKRGAALELTSSVVTATWAGSHAGEPQGMCCDSRLMGVVNK